MIVPTHCAILQRIVETGKIQAGMSIERFTANPDNSWHVIQDNSHKKANNDE